MMASRKKKDSIKPRHIAIYGTTTKEADVMTVTINEQTGDISFGENMCNVFSELSYKRTKGPKVLSRVPQTSFEISFDDWPAIRRNFDYVCAVDTNTREIRGRRVSATAVVKVYEQSPPMAKRTYWALDVPFVWEFIDLVEARTENFGWLAAFEQLLREDVISTSTRVGMIVDSDLGNIPSYNQRTSPVFDETYLPENVQLIYASADSGGDNFVNRVITVADKVSSQTLCAIENGDIIFNACDNPSKWYSGRRIVRVINSNPHDIEF